MYIPRVMVKMRLGGISNRSLRYVLRKPAEDWRALRHHRIGRISALLWKNFGKIGRFVTSAASTALKR